MKGTRPPVRLALVAAFPFPAPQGSQRFAGEQARALRAAGAEVTLLCYGTGDGRPCPDVNVVRIPEALSPPGLRAGLDRRKPAADRALLRALLAEHERAPFDAVLAHNAEAGLVAFAARRQRDLPVVYVAHTLWREELESYLPRVMRAPARAAGAALDAALARGADAVLTLSQAARAALAPSARGPVERILPGLAREPRPRPDDVAALCYRHGLTPDGFAVYAGNLDGYQDLPDLDAAAGVLGGLPVVAATHDVRGPRLPHLELHAVDSPEEARLLVYGARVAVVPRRHSGGFPIKLLQYMEAGRAIVAREEVADTLTHDESGWVVPAGSSPQALAAGLRRCAEDAALRARLGAGARKVLEHEHDWPAIARDTLALVGEARRHRARSRAAGTDRSRTGEDRTGRAQGGAAARR